ncbi:hypothetical protein ACFVIM_35145 [Streptomyces sp. NPDC057638]|uniref:hypothetical protein n=1 Tax=Streptomyces sp. NPDC057638 TaxID=3346190 RepID=UPI0036B8D999
MSQPVSPVRRILLGLVTLFLLVAGGWSSWETAQHVMFADDRESGSFTVTGCGDDDCTGRYRPDGSGPARSGLTIENSVAVNKGETVPVVVRPDSGEVIREDTGGVLHAWLPLGGSLLIASVLLGWALGLSRLGWIAAISGGGILVATFFAL